MATKFEQGLLKDFSSKNVAVSQFRSSDIQKRTVKDTNRVMSFTDDKNVLFLGIVVPHREHINSNDILVY